MLGRALAAVLATLASGVSAAEDFALEFNAQATYLRQVKPAFHSPYAGANSLSAASAASYSFTSTLYLAARLGHGWEAYLNPEFTEGVPFSQLRGTGGFTNRELAPTPRPQLPRYAARAFLRKTSNLRGAWGEQAS